MKGAVTMSPRDMIAHMQKRRTVLRCAGLCIVCGKRKTKNGRARCTDCQQDAGKGAAMFALTVEQDSKSLARMGICTRCKGNAAVVGRTICQECYDKQEETRKRNRQIKAEKWKSLGICTKCGKRQAAAGREHCLFCANTTTWRPERIKAKVTHPMVRKYLETEPAKAERELHVLQDIRDMFMEKFEAYMSDVRADAKVLDTGREMAKKLCRGVNRMVVVCQWIRDEEGKESEDLLLQLQENAKKRRDCLYMAGLVSSYGAGVQG